MVVCKTATRTCGTLSLCPRSSTVRSGRISGPGSTVIVTAFAARPDTSISCEAYFAVPSAVAPIAERLPGDIDTLAMGGRKHRALKAELVEDAIWATIGAVVRDPEELLAEWQTRREDASQVTETIRSELDQIDQQKRRDLAKIEKPTASFIDPNIPIGKEQSARFRADIQAEIDRIDERAAKLQQRLASEDLTDAQIQSLEEFVSGVGGGLDYADFAIKRGVIEALQLTGDVVWTEERRAEITLGGLFPPIRVGLSPGTSCTSDSARSASHPQSSGGQARRCAEARRGAPRWTRPSPVPRRPTGQPRPQTPPPTAPA